MSGPVDDDEALAARMPAQRHEHMDPRIGAAVTPCHRAAVRVPIMLSSPAYNWAAIRR
jgi:hypothetical protein